MRLGSLVTLVKRERQKGKVIGRRNKRAKRIARVMSNVARPWYSGEMQSRGITPNIWRED